jgi:hypothetical protein
MALSTALQCMYRLHKCLVVCLKYKDEAAKDEEEDLQARLACMLLLVDCMIKLLPSRSSIHSIDILLMGARSTQD